VSYARVLRAPGAGRLAAAAVVDRLPGGMATSLLALTRRTVRP
jgi:hypothetical protein